MTTDPDASERLVALRTARPPQQFPHAQATKIATAGVSLSAVFGIVAYLGHSAAAEANDAARELQRLAASETAAAALYRPPPTTPSTTPSTTGSTTGQSTSEQPAETVVSALPQVIVAVPVPAPAPAPRPSSSQGRQGGGAPAPSNTTKTSG